MTDPLFRVAVDVNLHVPGFGQALYAALTALEGRIMGAFEDLSAKVDALTAKNDELAAQVTEANDKTDALIVVANTTKDALVALRDEIAAGVVTAEQAAGLAARIDEVIARQDATIGALNAQDAETDAAAVNVAP